MSSTALSGKRILLSITGSIAAIKAPIIARELMRMGAEVVPILTEGALQFTTPTALSALTRQTAITSIFPKEKASAADSGTWHIHLARSADAMLIAPCSATTLGMLRAGIYDNAVTLLAASLPEGTPLVLAPAMDEEMWLQPAVQENLSVLRGRGALVIEPVKGALASGHVGVGRMPEPIEIVQQFIRVIQREPALVGKRILITGGPTYEPIDPVRFIGNRSSGKMAVALANAARELGGEVTLVMGPSPIPTNGHIERLDVETGEEMYQQIISMMKQADIIVMNAAVSDFTPETVSESKIKKRESGSVDDGLTLKLRRTRDILSEVAKQKSSGQIVVGFALEKGEQAEAYAKGKLAEKDLDMIVLNKVDETGAGFTHDTNKVTILTRSGDRFELPLMSKLECAREILGHIATLLK